MKKPSVYIAVLNDGWVRSELMHGLLRMSALSELPIRFEDPQLTRGQPGASVRCAIVKRFRASNCSYLIMLDNDQVPFHDLIDIVLKMEEGKMAIVSCPAQTKSANKLQWLAYSAYEKKENGFVSTDLDSIENPPEFLERDAVGTGCIIIKKEVLEDMKRPFEDIFDEDGERILGHDLNFCVKAGKMGYKVFTTPKKRCEHFKCVGISRLEVTRANS